MRLRLTMNAYLQLAVTVHEQRTVAPSRCLSDNSVIDRSTKTTLKYFAPEDLAPFRVLQMFLSLVQRDLESGVQSTRGDG